MLKYAISCVKKDRVLDDDMSKIRNIGTGVGTSKYKVLRNY